MSVRDDLVAAKALIDTPEKWCQGTYAKSLSAAQPARCTMGALRVITHTDAWAVKNTKPYKALVDQLPKTGEHDWLMGVVRFNDDPATTHADIMALFDRAINAASPPVDGETGK